MPTLLALLPKNGLALPGIRANQMSQIQLGAPGAMQDWKFHVQGPQVLFESPPGWKPGERATGKGPRFVYSLPRADFYLQWRFEEGEDCKEPIAWADPGRSRPVVVSPADSDIAVVNEPAVAAPALVQAVEDPDDDSDAPPTRDRRLKLR